MPNESLATYLNDHLAGSVVALELLDHLETLTRGDTVRVRTRRGTVEYVVTHVRIYRKSSLARHAGVVFSQQVPGRLVLITCEGWNGAGYDSNAVVLARPI